VYLDPRHIAHARLEAARRHLTVSAFVRELFERDIERKERAAKREEHR
jgi:hypothetical protein